MKRIISLLLCLLCVLAGMPCGMAETNTQLVSATIDGGNGDRGSPRQRQPRWGFTSPAPRSCANWTAQVSGQRS